MVLKGWSWGQQDQNYWGLVSHAHLGTHPGPTESETLVGAIIIV